MRTLYCPFLYGKFRTFFQIAAVVLTLGVAGCSGSSDQAEEPIAADQGASSDEMASDESSGLIIEQESTDDASMETNETYNETPQVEEDESAMSEAAATQEAVASDDAVPTDDTQAVPESILDTTVASEPTETPESLDATLDNGVPADDSSSMDSAIAAEPVPVVMNEDDSSGLLGETQPSEPMSMTDSTFGQSSGVLPPGVVASPGAAIFIKSKYEKPAYTASAASYKGNDGYVVKPGDTVSGISKKFYGNFSHWKQIASLNGIKAPYVIHPGDVVKVGKSVASGGSYSSKTAGLKTVKVKHGDTLSTIAGAVYGNAGAWKKLYNLNKGKISNPNVIQAGMVLAYSGDGYQKTVKVKKAKLMKKQVVKDEPAAPVAQPVVEEEAPVVETANSETEDEAAPAQVEEQSDEIIDVNLPAEEEE